MSCPNLGTLEDLKIVQKTKSSISLAKFCEFHHQKSRELNQSH